MAHRLIMPLFILIFVVGCSQVNTDNHQKKSSYINLNKKSTLQHGIYINHSTIHNSSKFNFLIAQSKALGINTFIVDLDKTPNLQYKHNIQLLLKNHIRYVPRIVIFPGGASEEQVQNAHFWQRKLPLIDQAIGLGAKDIQLDYIRYAVSRPHNKNNRHEIHKIIKWYKKRVHKLGARLQVAVFGITSFGPSHTIGQDVALFSDDVDTVCPMVYPSHFEPYKEHAKTPYKTIKTSMDRIKHKLRGHNRLIPYLELFNYRVKMTEKQRIHYTKEQIKAVHDSKINGWYFWSASSTYNILFKAIGSHS